MPLYEYFCRVCQERFETLRGITDRGSAQCPQCGRPAEKVMSVVNYTFGFRLSDRSHERFGPRDEYVKDV